LLFEAPTIETLAREVERERRGGGAQAPVPPLVSVARDRRLPVSFGQQRLWFLDRLAPESAAYNMPVPLRFRGALSVPARAASIAGIVARHEILRTSYGGDLEDGPEQRIAPIGAAARIARVRSIDLARLPGDVLGRESRRLVTAEARRPFDIARGPVLRVELFRLGAGDHVALFNVHHIASDGWSAGILVEEIAAFYAAAVTGGAVELSALPVQYADFAVWQRRRLAGEALDAELGWWRERLAGTPALLELPADRQRPPIQSFLGEIHPFVWPAALAARLEAAARRSSTTPFSLLLAAFASLLARLSGRPLLSVGTPIAGRDRLETERLIGLFVNTLVLPLEAPGELTFRRLLAQVRETSLAAFAHQELPFDLLVDALQPERSLAFNPLFQVMFVLQNVPMGGLDLPDVALEPFGFGGGGAQLDLELMMTAEGGTLSGSLNAATDLFDPATARRWIGHLETLLDGALADPERRLDELPLLEPSERHQLEVEWNASGAPVPFERRAHELIFEWAERTPTAIAAAEAEARWTYAELVSRARRAAGRLAGSGVGPGTVVALLADRSLEFLGAVLGILEAGGAYLPLDPLHPAGRLAQVLERSGTPFVVVAPDFAEVLVKALATLDAERRPRVLTLESLLAEGGEDVEAPRRRADGADLAYAIFTSGSTGVPKGAMVEHRGMLNHLFAKIGELSLSTGDVVAQTATQSFDISVWQFLAALVVGGRVEIFDDLTAHDPARLLPEVARRGVTILETVPSILRFLLDEIEELYGAGGKARPGAPDLSRLRWLIPTGEALPPELARRWLARCPNIPLLNAYGPTECSDDVTHHRVLEPPAFF